MSSPNVISAAGQARRIDVHQHILPPLYRDYLQAQGISQLAGIPLPDWSPQAALALMDANGIATAITSVPCSDLPFSDALTAAVFTRSCNAYSAKLMQSYPGRFGAFAYVPQQYVPQACVEVAHALDQLKFDGVLLSASSGGKFLGDPFFEPLLSTLDQRSATVFVHPGVHPSSLELALDTPKAIIEMPCDITRAAVNLIVTGAMERYPNIRWILANAGGFLPYVAWRVSLANAMTEFSELAPQGILHYVRRFYFDTAQAASRIPLVALRELVAPQQILFGSDYPRASAELTATQCQLLDQPDLWSADVRAGIARNHALSLFPRFAEDEEYCAPVPPHRREQPLARLKRQLTLPLRQLAAQLRK
ncbi:MAG: amidohydrolase family protein [Pseudomonas sp.]|uniref:amidohydrolase family protein n=1 Tax=Pseudomonas sp. TaxID=306 RepID=UPI003BB5F971